MKAPAIRALFPLKEVVDKSTKVCYNKVVEESTTFV
jgi:hypothetical protein